MVTEVNFQLVAHMKGTRRDYAIEIIPNSLIQEEAPGKGRRRGNSGTVMFGASRWN